MKYSKLFASLLMGGATVLSLASCGGTSSANTIVFYCSAGDSLAPQIQLVIDEYNATHTDFQVELQNPGGGYDGVKEAVIADISAGTLPSLAYCYPDHVAEYLEANVVVDLADFIKDPEIGYSAEEIADFIPGYWAEGYEAFGGSSIDDGMYTVPFSKSTEVMYYNDTVLKKLVANGTISQEEYDSIDSWTWDTFWDVCAKIEASEYSSWVPMGYDSVSNWFITLCEQYGYDYTSATGNHYLFNNSDCINMLNDLKEKFDAGLFTTQDIYGSYTSNLFTAGLPNNPTAEASCVFSIGSSAGAHYQVPTDVDQFEVGITSLPQADPNNKKSINQGPSLVMLDQGNSEEAQAKERACWEFVKMLLEPEFQASFSKSSGYMPVRLSAQSAEVNADYAEWLQSDDAIARTIVYALANAESFYVSPAFVGSNKARIQVGAALTNVLTDAASAADALQDAYDECVF